MRGLFCSPTIRFDWSETTQWLRDPAHNHASLLSAALKFYPATWSGIKYGYGVRERIRHEGWELSARVIHVDFKEHNTNQIGSECGLPHSHLILVSNVFTDGKVFWIFRPHNIQRSRIHLQRNIWDEREALYREALALRMSARQCSFCYAMTVMF